MSRKLLPIQLVAAVGLCLCLVASVLAGPPGKGKSGEAIAMQKPQPKKPAFAELLGGAQGVDGVIKLYRKDTKLYGELGVEDLNRDFLMAIAIARGIGQLPLVGGMTWGFGDDWIWQFRKVDDRIQVVRRNVRFRAKPGSPLEKAVYMSYTDSILFSLPIITTGPSGGAIVDLTPVFMSDLPQIAEVLRGFRLDPNRSTWSKVKGFKKNVEIEVAATYASGGQGLPESVPDDRSATIYIHYSISQLPQTGFQPRKADDRVGHFVSVVKDFSQTGKEDQFVRYVNRWDLRKAEPSAAVSPPVAPIIFWIEKTVPYKFRGAVREGILEWNKAFEKAGFADAIEVRQQPDDATWDPEDISYNTFRWITSNAGMAMGPSRVNPLTGQILDADIIFDADFIETWTKTFDVTKPKLAADEQGGLDLQEAERFLAGPRHNHVAICDCARQMSEQMAFGAMALSVGRKSLSNKQFDKLLIDGVKSVVIHEVGHTLGLRHNFKASGYMTMDELANPEKTRNVGLSASIMDYVPLNLAPKGKLQGDYFSHTIGPYDYWAIEYAYRPLPGGTEGETAALWKIASRGTEPALQFATDEDASDFSPDPMVNRFDLSKDPIEYARWRVELIGQVLPGLVDRMVEPGEGYQMARQAFAVLLREHDRAMHFVARFIGGVSVNRNHKGDPNARPPFVVTEAKKQREALEFLGRQVFSPDAYQLPSQFYNYLAPPYWSHWGMKHSARTDFPIRDTVLTLQENVLNQVLAPPTLARLVDSELKVPPKQDAFTAAELLQGLTAAIFSETEKLQEGQFTDRAPAINTLRRELQRRYFQRLAQLAMDQVEMPAGPRRGSPVKLSVPADCQAVAASELQALEGRIKKVLAGPAKLDTYTRSHLTDLAARIHKVLDARLELKQP